MIYKEMTSGFQKKFSLWLLLIMLVLGMFLELVPLNPAHASGVIRQLEEAPGKIVYQSRQNLKDQHGNVWQAIAFKRINPDGKTSFYLRLVGFPGITEIDRSKPLILTNSLGKILTATDASSEVFSESNIPQPNVGEYDLQPLLSQLSAEIPLKLTLPTINGEAVSLSLPSSFVQKWQTINIH